MGVVERPWAKRLLLRGFYAATEKELQHNIVMAVPYGEVRYGSRVYGVLGRYEVDLSPRLAAELVAAYSKRTTDFEDRSTWVYNWRGERVRERRVAGELENKPTDQSSWQHSGFARAGLTWRLLPGHTVSVSSSPAYTTRTGDERLQADPTARDPLNAKRKLLTLVSGLEYQLDLFDDRLSNVLFFKDYVYRAKNIEPITGGTVKERDSKRHRAGVGDALRYRFTDWLYAKASYELATRLPSADELFGDGVLIRPNAELGPEISHNANLGPRLELTRTPAGEFVAEVNAFYRDSDQLIVLLGNDRFYTYQNVYRAIAKGLENSVAWTAPRRFLGVEAGLTWLDVRNASSSGTFGDFEGDRVPNRPYLTASWGAHLRFTGFPGGDDTLEPYYAGRYVHEFYRGWESQGLEEFKQVVDAQVVHSAGVTWSLSAGFGRTSATLELDNVTSAKAFDNFGVERPGRAVYLKVAGEI
jgi:vitamin B12 transporter